VLSVSAAHGSGVTQTPSGHAAPAGQADASARHSQPAAAAHVAAVPLSPHASFTIATGTGRLFVCW
jgi:hypothetical protein